MLEVPIRVVCRHTYNELYKLIILFLAAQLKDNQILAVLNRLINELPGVRNISIEMNKTFEKMLGDYLVFRLREWRQQWNGSYREE